MSLIGWDVFYDICLGCVDEIQQFLEWIFDPDRFIGMISPSISVILIMMEIIIERFIQIIREFFGKNILDNDLIMNLCRTCVFQVHRKNIANGTYILDEILQIELGQLNPQCVTSALDLLKISLINLSR